ncbi:hypothetical protein ACFE04_022909 [Oxalis oulophora]
MNSRGALKLQVACPQKANGMITIDPEPNWDFNSLLSELNSLENKLNGNPSSSTLTLPLPFIKDKPRQMPCRNRRTSGFVMHLSDDDIGSSSDEDQDSRFLPTNHFACDQIYLSDSDDESTEESALEIQTCLMDGGGFVESSLFEMTRDQQDEVKEEIRNRFTLLEKERMSVNEKSSSALVRVEKYRDTRKDMEKKFDTLAEGLDDHLTVVQRDHEIKSQLEERKIRSDAAYEEAKRREKDAQEEKLRQEMARSEAEAKLRADEAKRAAIEAERKSADEAAKREADENLKKKDEIRIRSAKSDTLKGNERKNLQPTGIVIRAAERAISIELGRLQKLKEIEVKNQALSVSQEDLSKYERLINRMVKNIRGVKDNVSTRADELVKIFNDPKCPRSFSLETFAKKVVSLGRGQTAFACGYVMVLVTSKAPDALDLLLAEFHKACIYTVPKHMVYTESAFESKDAYYKAIGFQEDNGKMELAKNYLERVETYMKLYGALVQTEIPGVENRHGIQEGWAWLARFLNTLPPNSFTAVALYAFLQMAGYALFRKYKLQFKKILTVISEEFLGALKARREAGLNNSLIQDISAYIEDQKYLGEPEGRSLQDKLLSRELNYQESSEYQQPNRFQQSNQYQNYSASRYF